MLCASQEITLRDTAVLLRGLRRMGREPPLMTPGYLALRQHAAWIDVSARARIRLTGEDRARLLHAMTTNQIQALKPGEGCYAFFLNAQGRILADVNVLCFADHLLLDSEPELRAKIYEHLDRYIIADDATLEDQTEQTAAIAVEGPEAESVLRRLDAPVPEAAGSHVAWSGRAVARLSTTGSGGYFVILRAAEKQALIDELVTVGISPASPEDARQVRIENGHPRYGEEITERYLVQETAQMHAVNFTKGCYIGQEIVERVRSRGQVHRLLRRLEMDTATVPAAGSKLAVDGAPAAEIASAVFSPALNKTVALAYVRAPFAEPGTRLNLEGTQALVSLPG
jgi:folate-binding protein YgfZ